MGDKNTQAKVLEACLLAAVKRGSLVVVRTLLSHPSCDLLARDEEGNTALHIAASRGHHEVVLELASRYSTPEDASAGKNNDGQTPLHLACSKGWIKCVDPLAITFPSELNVKDSSGIVPLMTASLAGHENIVSLLKQRYKVNLESEDVKLPVNQEKNKSEEINTDISKLSITKESSCLLAAAKRGSLVVVRTLLSHPSCDLLAKDEKGNTALHIAASRGHHDVVLELASRHSTPSACKNDKKQVPLHLASFKGWRECVRILATTFKEDVAVKDEYVNLPLHYAALYGHSKVVDCLCVEFNCDPESKGLVGNNCLHMACHGGHVHLVKSLLVTYRCSRDAVNNYGSLATDCAAFCGHLKLLKVLINEFGYSPNAVRSTDGKTLLHHACKGKHVNTVKYLMNECKLDLNARDQNGFKSIHSSCVFGQDSFEMIDDFHYSHDVDPPALVDILISNKCKPMDKVNNGSTAFHIAAKTDTECTIIKHLVIKCSCSVHCVNDDNNTPLHVAAADGQVNIVHVLLSELGANAQTRNKRNDTALNVAALYGHSNVVSLLVGQFGCSPHTKGYNNRTPLHQACDGGNLVLVEKLIDDYHCDPMARDDKGFTPLHIAALAGKEQIVRQLVANYNCFVECKDNECYTPLHRAALKGHLNVVQVLLSELGADVQAHNKQNNTALNIAALNGDSNVVTLFVEQFKCSPHTKGYNNRTALHQASRGGHFELVEKLIDGYHCDPMARDDEGLTPLHIAALEGKEQVVKRLVSNYNCSVECGDNDDNTPLHRAAENGHLNVVQMLLSELGADVQACDKQSDKPLNLAALNGHSNVLTLLVEQFKCSPHTKGYNNRTPLHQASRGGHLELVDKLIDDYHCDPMARDDGGLTPLHIAATTGNEQVVRRLVANYNPVVEDKRDNSLITSVCQLLKSVQEEIVRRLVGNNGPVECKDNDGCTPLHSAAQRGHLKVVQLLLSELGADVHARNKENDTALNLAALYGHSNVVILLVEKFGCSPHTQGYNNRTPLHNACSGGHLELVEKLIDDYHCDAMARDDKGLTPLHIAALVGKEHIVRRLVANYNCFVDCKDNECYTPLHRATLKGHLNVVQVLLSELGADVQARNNENETALSVAALYGHSNVVSLLVGQFGCSLHTNGYNNGTPLHNACSGGHLELVEKLIDDYHCDAMARDDKGLTPLHIAALAGKEQIVRRLVANYNCFVDCKDNECYTPLHRATLKGHFNVVQVLLSELGADVQARNKENDTALSVAALYGHSNVVSLLVGQFGCSPHTNGYNNRTPLHNACSGGHLELVEKLIDDYHCDPMARDDKGLTPLHIAALAGKEQIVRRLVANYNCFVECKDNECYTPLHRAALKGHLNVVQVLLSELGADVQARNKENDTALNVAAWNGHSNVVTLLVEQFERSPNTKGYNNRTLLHQASRGGHLELVEKLIDDFHCDPMARDDNGLTPLHIAALTGKEQIVRRLVANYNCFVECKDNDGYTPLHRAAQRGQLKVVQLLLSELGADVQARNKKNNTALNETALNGHSNVVILLVEQFGCSPHTKGYNNRTPLHQASRGGNLELVEKLIDDFHCDPMARDDEGLTPIHIAALTGKSIIMSKFVLKYNCTQYVSDNDGNTILHTSILGRGDIKCLKFLVDVIGIFPSIKNKKGKYPLDRVPLELRLNPNIRTCVKYLSKHAVSEYRHTPPKLLVFNKTIVLALNDYSTYSLLSSPYTQSCGLCYMDSAVNDLWVCQVGPETRHTSVLQSLMSGPIFLAVVTINLSIPTDQAVREVCSQVSLAEQLANRDGSRTIRILLVGNSSCDNENLFNTVCKKIVDKKSVYFTQYLLSCAKVKFPEKIFPVISDFISTSVNTETNPDAPEITHGSIYLLKFLYQMYPGKSYVKFSQLAKQLQNRRIMMEDHPEEILACLWQLDQQGYLLTTGTSDHPQYIILNPLHMLHTLEEFSRNTSDPLARLGLYSQRLLSCIFPDSEYSMIESFLSKLGLSSEVPDPMVNLVMKQDLYTHVGDRNFFIPQLATSARQLNCWTCQPETVFSCGLRVIVLGKLNSFSSPLTNDILLQVMEFIISNVLIKPYVPVHCTLWKGGIHWMVENVEVLVEIVDDGNSVVLMGRSDVYNQLKCVDMFVKVVDMVLEVKSVCCGGIVHKVNALDPIALESKTIPCDNEMLWCDVSTAARALRTGRKNIQSTCKTQQFSVDKLNWLFRFTLQDKLFPMDYKVVSAFLESVSEKWQEIARELGLSEQTCHRIQETNGRNPDLCCSQMIEECLIGPGVKFNWHSLTEALRNLNLEHLADTILLDWSYHEKTQGKVVDDKFTDMEIGVVFLQQFAVVAEPHWKLLAPYINPSTPSGPGIKEEPVMDQLQRWKERMCPTFGDLTEILSRLYIVPPQPDNNAKHLLHTSPISKRVPDDFQPCHHSCPESLSYMCSTPVHSENVDIAGKIIECRELGFSIDFPSGAVESPVTVSVCCSFKTVFFLPNGYEFVSPVYILHVYPKTSETRFLKKVTLSLRHWAKSDGSDLSFGFCRFPNINLSYPFEVQSGGTFTSLTSGNSGTIEVEHFSGGAIMRAITGTITWISSCFSANHYVASLAYPLSTRMTHMNPWLSAISLSLDHPVVSENTLKWMKENYPGFVWARDEREADFESEAQSYIVQPNPMDKVNIKGKNTICRVDVDRLNRQHSIGSIIGLYPPRVFLEVVSSEFISCSVDLKGVKDCSFTLTSPSQPRPASRDHDTQHSTGSGVDEAVIREPGHTRQEPTLKLLHKELYDVQYRWYGFGLQLDLSPSTLNSIRSDAKTCEMCFIETCKAWLNKIEGACWEDIVDALKVMRHVALAKRIHSAYCT